ncbi:MAG TPA: YegS/Rv2252/BmrU family lipid kinase [Euzebyales bacterium]|nr:YegS/Rv2252/BmrU family lipid kinase [Euzebyales bacterium]
MSDQTLFLSNSAAGSADDEVVTQVLALLREGFDVVSAGPETPAELEATLAPFRGDRIIVGGGDGSLHLLVNALGGLGRLEDIAVGLVPLGTGNDFAAAAGIPAEPLAAARRCLDGEPTTVDVIRADDGEYVVNAAHAGVGAVAAERAQGVKAFAGRLAYPLGAIQAAATEAGWAVTLQLDGEGIFQGDMLLTMVANGSRIGGGTHLEPNADPFDGMIDVLLIEALPLHERPGLGLDLQRGTHLERSDVHHWRGRQLHLQGTDISHNRDGELRHGLADVTYTIQPAAWRLLR